MAKQINVTRQQFDKGQRYLNGEVKDIDMHILAQTYINEIVSLVGYVRVRTGNESAIFTEFCKAMTCSK